MKDAFFERRRWEGAVGGILVSHAWFRKQRLLLAAAQTMFFGVEILIVFRAGSWHEFHAAGRPLR